MGWLAWSALQQDRANSRFTYRLGENSGPSKTNPAKLPSLWKPEPALLLTHSRELALTERQLSAVKRAEAGWTARKANLLAKMDGSIKAPSGTVEKIHEDLQDYAALSRAYDVERQAHWNEALKSLSPEQKLRVETLRPEDHL